MKYTNITILLLSLVYLSIAGSVTVDRTLRALNLNDYTQTSTCVYYFNVQLSDSKAFTVTSPPGQLNYLEDSKIVVGNLIFTMNRGTSGDLVVETTDSDNIVSTVILESYECLGTPQIEYDETSKPYESSLVAFVYDLKITTPLTKFLANKYSLGTTSSTQYSILVRPFSMQRYSFYIHPTSPKDGYADPFTLSIKVSETQTISIQITPPISNLPLLGTQSAETNSINPFYSMSIFKYEGNTNRNKFLSYKPIYYRYNHLMSEGNAESGTIILQQNRKGVSNVYVANINDKFFTYENNIFKTLYTFEKSLPVLPFTIVPSSYLTNYVDTLNSASLTFLNIIYNVNTKVYDRLHTLLITKQNYYTTKYLTFPFAYSAGSINSGFKVSFSYPTWGIFQNSITYKVYNQQIQYASRNHPNAITENMDPIVDNIEFLGIINNRLYFKLHINTGSIPFDRILSDSIYGIADATVLATSANLIQGDEYDGVYEFSHKVGAMSSIRVYNDFGGVTVAYLPNYHKTESTLDHLKSVKFHVNNINTSSKNSPINNRLEFEYTVPDLYFRFVIYEEGLVKTDTYVHQYYDVFYNPVTQRYVVDFEVYPRRPFVYQILASTNNPISSWDIETLFPEDNLKVTFDNMDEMPPIVTSVTHPLGNEITIDSSVQGHTTATFSVTIKDTYNGLKNGTVWIASDLDPVGFNFTFTPEDVVSGDMFLGTYNFDIKINNKCVSQKYIIQDMLLYDNSAIISSVYGPFPNPFFDEIRNVPLTVTCSMDQDTVAPTLTSFNLITPGPIQVTDVSRKVVIEFTITETGSGLEPSRTPTVYATELGLRTITVKSELIDANSNLYRATFDKIPYGFGSSGGIYFSIYGIIDNHLNFNGYSSSDLQSMGFSYYVPTTRSFSPWIQSAQHKTEDLGFTTVSGFNLDGTNVVVEYSDSIESNAIFTPINTILFKTNTVLTFNRDVTNEPFSLRITKDGIQSNIFIVEPTQNWLNNGIGVVQKDIQTIVLLLNLIENPLLIQPSKLELIIQLLIDLQTKSIDDNLITQIGSILPILRARPTPQLSTIIQLRSLLVGELESIVSKF